MAEPDTFLLAYLDERGKPRIEQHGTLSADDALDLIRAIIDHYFNHISKQETHATTSFTEQ